MGEGVHESCGALRALVPDGSTVCLIGDFDFGDGATFEAALAEATAPPAALTVDLGELTFLGSTGLRALLDLRRERQGVTLRRAAPKVRRLLEISGAAALFSYS